MEIEKLNNRITYGIIVTETKYIDLGKVAHTEDTNKLIISNDNIIIHNIMESNIEKGNNVTMLGKIDSFEFIEG